MNEDSGLAPFAYADLEKLLGEPLVYLRSDDHFRWTCGCRDEAAGFGQRRLFPCLKHFEAARRLLMPWLPKSM